MRTKIATSNASGAVVEVCRSLHQDLRSGLDGAAPCLVVAFASTSQPLAELAPGLATLFPESTVLSCSTAGEFTQSGDLKGSTSAFAVAGDFRVFGGRGSGLGADPAAAVSAALAGIPASVEGFPHRCAILLLDPFAGNSEEATLLIAAHCGGDIRLAGGAAGDDLRMASTAVALGPVSGSDAIALAMIFSREPLGVGVAHAHSALSAPIKVTRAEGNVVHEIDGQPAWEVWKQKVAACTPSIDPEQLAPEQEGAFLLTYEAGLASGGELKIRAPLSRDERGAISFACGIPQGASLRITESTPDRQVASAREAARRARAQVGDAPIAGALVFDCICRNLILGDRFGEAVAAIRDELGDVPLAGFETYGEIALDAGDFSGFHNTTTVVLTFPAQ